MEMQLQTKDTLATLHLDPRTKLYLLIVGNVALFLAPSLLYEIALVVCVVILGILVGAKRFTVSKGKNERTHFKDSCGFRYSTSDGEKHI